MLEKDISRDAFQTCHLRHGGHPSIRNLENPTPILMPKTISMPWRVRKIPPLRRSLFDEKREEVVSEL